MSLKYLEKFSIAVNNSLNNVSIRNIDDGGEEGTTFSASQEMSKQDKMWVLFIFI